MHDASSLKKGSKRFNIRSVNGQYIDLAHPTQESIDLGDMTHALGNIARFLGHTLTPITVLEHLLNAYDRACALTDDEDIRFAVLMHDAHECYVCDVPTPLKHLVGDAYMDIEDAWQREVFTWAGLNYDLADHPIVKQVDREMLLTEARDFHGVTEQELKDFWPEGEPLPYYLDRRHIPSAKFDFTNRVSRMRAARAARSLTEEAQKLALY